MYLDSKRGQLPVSATINNKNEYTVGRGMWNQLCQGMWNHWTVIHVIVSMHEILVLIGLSRNEGSVVFAYT